MIKSFVKKGVYYDSVKLMLVTQKIKTLPGIIEAGVVMGTDLNKDILERVQLLSDEARTSSPADLIIGINAESQEAIDTVMNQLDELLNAQASSGEKTQYRAKSLNGALKAESGSNVAIISIPGHFAHIEARKALQNGLHVLLFSDNVPVEEEKSLKEYAKANDLLLMGPDCGTSIINGVPLGFANKIRTGSIGIVGASGTGIQEVSTLIHQQGYGISHAIGTGGRDLSLNVGGITMMQALQALNKDEKTQIIVVISKPPAKAIAEQMLNFIQNEIKKPVVVNFLGDQEVRQSSNTLAYTSTLEDTALKAVSLLTDKDQAKFMDESQMDVIAQQEAQKLGANKKYIRGLYCGGTLNYEAILMLEKLIGGIYSNTLFNKDFELQDPYQLQGNACIDLGDDAFTVGRAHPMIDPSLRDQLLEEQILSPDASIILLDVVLGYGAHPNPAQGILNILKKHASQLAHKTILVSICGTDQDPQNFAQIQSELEQAGVIVTPSNCCAATIAGKIFNYK